MFVGLPEDPPDSSLLSKEDMEYYVQQFKKSGFRLVFAWVIQITEIHTFYIVVFC